MKTLVIATAILLASRAVTMAQDNVDVPKAAIQWMASLVGDWEVRGTVNGEEVAGTHSARWAPGEYCIQYTQQWKGAITGHSAGIGGWSPERKQYVEHWYLSDGGCRTHWYSLTKENGVWVGGVTFVDKDGKKSSSKVTLEQRPNEWLLVATDEASGEKSVLSFKKVK